MPHENYFVYPEFSFVAAGRAWAVSNPGVTRACGSRRLYGIERTAYLRELGLDNGWYLRR
jgi:hypothetical protein